MVLFNKELLEKAKAAYDSKDYSEALRGYYECLKDPESSFEPGEAGLVYHMLGNCLVKMHSFDDAAKAYENALQDTDYENATAVHSNYGLALSSMGDYRGAITQFETVLKDPQYKTPYKTYTGLGNAYMQLGDFASAGTAFRNAAVDERNPAPVKALLNLGVCFMGLNRPADAVETYKAIFEFNPDQQTLNKTYANMGQAYVALGQMDKAVESFENAIRDDSYELSDAARNDYMRAMTPQANVHDDSGIDAIGSEWRGYEDTMPVGEDGVANATHIQDEETLGAGIPSADDTGFWTLPDDRTDLEELLKQGNGKKRHRGRNIFLTILIILVLLVAAGGVLFWQGFGYPSQEAVVEKLFSEHAAGQDVSDCWITATSDEDTVKIKKIMNSVAPTSNVAIDYVDPGMMESEVVATATLSDGGKVRYNISLTRDFSSLTSWIGWKVNGIEFAFPSTQDKTSTQATTSSGSDDEPVVTDTQAAPAAEQAPAAEAPAAEAPADQAEQTQQEQ